MSSISPSCQTLKDEYDGCFNSWFTEHYLKGDTSADMCTNLFKKYQACVKVKLKNE
jgi:TRIAP1/MDM35 family protein